MAENLKGDHIHIESPIIFFATYFSAICPPYLQSHQRRITSILRCFEWNCKRTREGLLEWEKCIDNTGSNYVVDEIVVRDLLMITPQLTAIHSNNIALCLCSIFIRRLKMWDQTMLNLKTCESLLHRKP